MNFFRLRIINTLLVLLIGVILGYIIKERLGGKEADRYVARYPRGYTAAKPAPDDNPETPAAKGPAAAGGEGAASTRSLAVSPRAKTDGTGEDFALPVKPAPEADYEITYGGDESQTGPGPADGQPARADKAENKDSVVRGAEDGFFKNPARYAGQDLGMELQMILAKKTQNGWTLNFVYARGGKNVDYVYIEDDFLLGEKPELKIGYFYNIIFKCVKGDLSSGNKLLGINPSGKKASWATGVSAVE
ncbi:MAG: hypothetical protein KKH28_10685 [Elusimicrobia bacterium]|nr:hypothetical protein [Elusimicrobiota bacterium]